MRSAAEHGEPGRAGVLILRVWLEGSGGDGRLRVRIIGQRALDSEAQDITAASTIEETLAYVRAWLERFAASGPALADGSSAAGRSGSRHGVGDLA